MAEEKREGAPDPEVEEILNDLDAILGDLGDWPQAVAAPQPEPAAPQTPPAPEPSPAAAPPAAAPAPAESRWTVGTQPPALAAKPSAPDATVDLGALPAAPAKPPEKQSAPPPQPAVKAAPEIPKTVVEPAKAASVQPPAPDATIELGARSIAAAKPLEKKPEAGPGPAPAPAPVATGPRWTVGAQPPAAAAKPAEKPPAAEPPKTAPPAPASAPKQEQPQPAQKPPAQVFVTPPPAPAQKPVAEPPKASAKNGCSAPDDIPEVPMPEKLGKDQIRRLAYFYLGKYRAERDAMARLLDSTAQTMSKKPLFLRRVLYQEVAEESDALELRARAVAAKAVTVLAIIEGLSEAKSRALASAFSGAGPSLRVVAPADSNKKTVTIDIVVDVMLRASE